MDQTKLIRGYLFAICSAVIYGCMPLMANFIYDDGVSPMTLVFLRNFLALIPLAALAYKQKKTLKIPKKALPSIGFLALFGCCIATVLLLTSYQYIPSGTATVFHFVYPAVVVIGGALCFRKKLLLGNVVSILLCIAGIGLYYTPGQPLNWTGTAFALLSGVAFAVYVLFLPRFPFRETVDGFLFSFYIAAASSVITFALCIATGQLAFPTSLTGWGLCVLFSLLITVGAVVLFQQSAFMIGGERTSILSTLEPITSVVVGIAVFHEEITARILVGSLLVITASLLIAIVDLKKRKP